MCGNILRDIIPNMCTTVRESSISSFTPTNRCVNKFTSSSVMSMNNRIILKKSRY